MARSALCLPVPGSMSGRTSNGTRSLNVGNLDRSLYLRILRLGGELQKIVQKNDIRNIARLNKPRSTKPSSPTPSRKSRRVCQ